MAEVGVAFFAPHTVRPVAVLLLSNQQEIRGPRPETAGKGVIWRAVKRPQPKILLL
jgi:hypothetical protein